MRGDSLRDQQNVERRASFPFPLFRVAPLATAPLRSGAMKRFAAVHVRKGGHPAGDV